MSSGFTPCSRISSASARAMFCASSSTSDFGIANSAFARSAPDLVLDVASILRLNSSFRFGGDLGLEVVEAAAGDAERLRELGVDRRQHAAPRPPSP